MGPLVDAQVGAGGHNRRALRCRVVREVRIVLRRRYARGVRDLPGHVGRRHRDLDGREPEFRHRPRLHVIVAAGGLHVPWLGVTVTGVTPTGRVSVTVTLVASSGPLLKTSSVYVNELPVDTGSRESVLKSARSAVARATPGRTKVDPNCTDGAHAPHCDSPGTVTTPGQSALRPPRTARSVRPQRQRQIAAWKTPLAAVAAVTRSFMRVGIGVVQLFPANYKGVSTSVV